MSFLHLPPLLLFLPLFLVGGAKTAVSQYSDSSEPMCYDWGESSEAGVSILEGEAGWLFCPLFSHPSVYNYNSTQNNRLNLVWYRLPEGHNVEQPVQYSRRVSRDRERLWLQPAAAADTGQYICMLSNQTSCIKIAMRLKVLRPDEVSRGKDCAPVVAVAARQKIIPFQTGALLDCPDLQEARKMADGETTVDWSHKCNTSSFHSQRQQKGARLQIHVMLGPYEGPYFCRVRYERAGLKLHFTRSIQLSAVYPDFLPKLPRILQPGKDQISPVKRNSDVRLVCVARFPYLNTSRDMWWTVDGKRLEQLSDHHRFSRTNRTLKNDHQDMTVEDVLLVQDFQAQDLRREFNCSVRNSRGSETRRAQLEEEVSLPSLELGCGLGATLLFMLLLFLLYHVFWLELLLLYRSWFGTDERHTDHKEYDVYISYARNSEEENFVLFTLRNVLENELGFSVCIFDRDSLPGGTITDETLSFVARSRRLLVVVSPGYASRGSQALLELQAGLDGMALGGHLRVILVQYKPVQRRGWVRELRRARVALVLVRWQGDKSRELTSRFWKRLRVELPVSRGGRSSKDVEGGGGGKEMGLLRLHNYFQPKVICHLIGSSSSHDADLSEAVLLSMQRSRRLLFVLSPSFLVEKSFSLLECRLGLQLHRGHQAAVVAVLYRSVSKMPCAEALQIRRAAGTAVAWRRTRSEPRRSHFWLRLRLALPVRPLAAGRRLIDSTSSHSDLAALALQRVQRNQNPKDTANHSRTNRGRAGRMSVKGWSQHAAGCSGCTGFTGQVHARGAAPTEQASHNRTESQSAVVPKSTRDPGSTFDPASGPAP